LATRVRFRALDRGGAAPARQLGGAKEYGRGGDRFRRDCGSVGWVSGTASYGRDRGVEGRRWVLAVWPDFGAHRGWP
jgi:hypothetical protein